MDGIVSWMIGFQVLFWVAMFFLLIYLIVRRVRIRKEEHFEKRDN